MRKRSLMKKKRSMRKRERTTSVLALGAVIQCVVVAMQTVDQNLKMMVKMSTRMTTLTTKSRCHG